MSEFGAVAGLNPGTVSGIVMGNRSIAVHQLDCITKAMDKPEDYFYNRYVQEYMLDAPYDLADYIWGGYIKPEGIPKVVTRLKDKLGPAGALINSRAVGGFIYISGK
jgi:hypothetical protein